VIEWLCGMGIEERIGTVFLIVFVVPLAIVHVIGSIRQKDLVPFWLFMTIFICGFLAAQVFDLYALSDRCTALA